MPRVNFSSLNTLAHFSHFNFALGLYSFLQVMMKEDKEDELEEAKELFKEGLKKIFKATKKVSEKMVEGFKEGYAEDVTPKKK